MRVYVLEHVRTNNFSENMGKEIGEAWENAMKIVNDLSVTMYGVYHEYENDYKGNYTLSIATETLETLSSIEIPEVTYKIFPEDSSEENGVFKTWE